MKERSRKIIYGVAIAAMVIMVVLYWCGFQQLSGYFAVVAVPLCIAAIVIERHGKLRGALVVAGLAMVFAFPTSAHATGFHSASVYGADGSVGWIRPDGIGSIAIDTDAKLLTATWDFPQSIMVPWFAMYFPAAGAYVQISDDTGRLYYLSKLVNGSLPRTETISFPYSNRNVWVRMKIRMEYIVASPLPAFLYPEINLQVYIGTTAPGRSHRHYSGSGGCFMR